MGKAPLARCERVRISVTVVELLSALGCLLGCCSSTADSPDGMGTALWELLGVLLYVFSKKVVGLGARGVGSVGCAVRR